MVNISYTHVIENTLDVCMFYTHYGIGLLICMLDFFLFIYVVFRVFVKSYFVIFRNKKWNFLCTHQGLAPFMPPLVGECVTAITLIEKQLLASPPWAIRRTTRGR